MVCVPIIVDVFPVLRRNFRARRPQDAAGRERERLAVERGPRRRVLGDLFTLKREAGLTNRRQMILLGRKRVFYVIASVADRSRNRAPAHERIPVHGQIVHVVANVRVVADFAQPAPDAERQVALIDVRHPFTVAVGDEAVGHGYLIGKGVDLGILKQLVPERLRRGEAESADRRSVERLAFTLREPRVEIDICALAEWMLGAQEQALAGETIPIVMPLDGGIVETATHPGMAYGIGEPGHVATSLTIAERPRERAPARRSDEGGVAAHRYFP